MLIAPETDFRVVRPTIWHTHSLVSICACRPRAVGRPEESADRRIRLPGHCHSPNELVWLWRFWAARVKNKLSARPAGYSHGHIRYSAHFALVCYPVPPHIQDVGSRKSELCSALAFRSAKFTVRLKSGPTVTDHETISACLTAIFTRSL